MDRGINKQLIKSRPVKPIFDVIHGIGKQARPILHLDPVGIPEPHLMTILPGEFSQDRLGPLVAPAQDTYLQRHDCSPPVCSAQRLKLDIAFGKITSKGVFLNGC